VIEIFCAIYDANLDDQGRVVAYPVWPADPEELWFFVQCTASIHPARWQGKKLLLEGDWGPHDHGRPVFRPVTATICSTRV
jgi:hypothetical protein